MLRFFGPTFRLIWIRVAVVLATLIPFQIARASTDAYWINAASGKWLDANRWTGAYPDGSYFMNVFIDATGAPYTVTYDGTTAPDQTVAVDNINLNANDLTLRA